MPSKKEPSKSREWEQQRRNRLKNTYNELGKLLPSYDPAKPASQIEIIEKAAKYIEELKKKVNDLLSPSNNNDNKIEREEIQKLSERVKKLLERNEQLKGLLKDAGITVPTECGTIKTNNPKKWSNKISREVAEVLAKKELQKENKPKKIKRRKLNEKVTLRNRKIKIIGNNVKLVKKNRKLILSNGKIINSKPTLISLTPNPPCYIINNVCTSISTKTIQTAPIIQQTLKPLHTVTPVVNKNAPLNSINGGTLIFPNGKIVSVLTQSAVVPNQTILTANPPPLLSAPTQSIIVNPPQLNRAAVLVMPPNINTTVENKVNDMINKTLPRLKPKIGNVTKTTQVNKVPIPALTSKFARSNNYNANNDKSKPKILSVNTIYTAPGTSKTVSNNSKSVIVKEVINGKANKRKINENVNDSKVNSNNNKKQKIAAIANNDTSTENNQVLLVPEITENKDKENVNASTSSSNNDDDAKKKTATTTKYTIDSICKVNGNKLINENKANNENKVEECINNLNAEQRNESSTINNVTILQQNNSKVNNNDSTNLKNKEVVESNKINMILHENKLQVQEVKSSNQNDLEKALNKAEAISEPKNLEDLAHSELSNDLFASLHVPSGGQNPESTSPTAAFLLAFPLVSSLTGVKVTEVMEEETSDSRRDTPTLLQIGTMDNTKPTQSHSDSLTPSLLSLDNFSFFNSKDICGSFYQTFENVSGSIYPATTLNTTTTTVVASGKSHFITTSSKNNVPAANTPSTSFCKSNSISKTGVNNAKETIIFSNAKTQVNESKLVLSNQSTSTTKLVNSSLQNVIVSTHTSISSSSKITLPDITSSIFTTTQATMMGCSSSSSSMLYTSVSQKNLPVSYNTDANTFLQNSFNLPLYTQANNIINNNNSSNTNKYFTSKSSSNNKQSSVVTEKLQSCSRYTNLPKTFSNTDQYNTFDPFTDIPKSNTTYSYPNITSKAYNEPIYSQSGYSYQLDSNTLLDSTYISKNSNSSNNNKNTLSGTNNQQNYCYPYENYSDYNKISNDTLGNFYHQQQQQQQSQPSTNANKNNSSNGNKFQKSGLNKNQPRQPVNWMTTPDVKQQQQQQQQQQPQSNNTNANNDLMNTNFVNKDVEFMPSSLYLNTNTFGTGNTQNYMYNSNAPIYPTGDLHNNFNKMDSFVGMQSTNTFQRSDVEVENQFAWSPTKLPQLLDTQHSFVSTSLPTLVGDLALGNNPPLFTEQKQEKPLSRTAKERRVKTQNTYDSSQTNFLSVSQLVDHNKTEPNPNRVSNRRNSGNRAKPQSSKSGNHKRQTQKSNNENKDIIGHSYNHHNSGNKTTQIKSQSYVQGIAEINADWGTADNKSIPNQSRQHQHKNSNSNNYTAEALIGHHNQDDESKTRQSNYTSSLTSKSLSMGPFFPDNILPYFPTVDIQTDANSFTQQNQNYQPTFNANLPSTIQTNTYSSSTLIPTPSITSNYIPTTNFIPDLTSHEFPILSDNLNLFSHSNPRPIQTDTSKTSYSQKNSMGGNNNKQSSSSTTSTNAAPNNLNISLKNGVPTSNATGSGLYTATATKKASKKKVVNEATVPNFVDIGFLSMPGAINSPILPDDFHAHTNFLPPPTPTQLYPCKNSLYPKESNELSTSLLPIPPVSTRVNVQHPEISPSLSSAGTSLTNFNLSTIFPEMNKGSIMHGLDVYPYTRTTTFNPQKNYMSSNSQASFNIKSSFSSAIYNNTATSTQSFPG